MKRLAIACRLAAGCLIMAGTTARAADEVDIFALTGSLTAIQQTTRIVGTGDAAEELLTAKTITLSPTGLINLARGNSNLATSTTGFALGLTCEPVPRVVVISKGPLTTIGDEAIEAVIGEITIDGGSSVVQEKRVTFGGATYTDLDYFMELADLDVPAPMMGAVGFVAGNLRLSMKEAIPTNPADLYPECPLSVQIQSAIGEFEVDTTPAGGDNLNLLVTKGTLSAARTRIGTVDASP